MAQPLIAIHDIDRGFHPRWVDYCERNNIPYRRVNCYRSDLVAAVADCDALMWHHTQMDGRDHLMARPALTALEQAGTVVFPDFHTAWHFDNKLAQKYLFEALGIPTPRTEAFFDRDTALAWAATATWPQVFKLKGGAGAVNVRLVHSASEARRLVRRAFGRGHPNYDALGSLKERWRKYRMGSASIREPAKGLLRVFQPPPFARVVGRDVGYILFQEFIPGLNFDYRVKVIGKRAWAFKRYTRPNDFRASGSGNLDFSHEKIPIKVVEFAFSVAEDIGLQCAAFDVVLDTTGQPTLIEVSYGFGFDVGENHGFWDRSLHWHDSEFDPFAWMVEQVLAECERRKRK
jgi:glutathione synthase/RimK-type ligase-like ATP-grasp enzyme